MSQIAQPDPEPTEGRRFINSLQLIRTAPKTALLRDANTVSSARPLSCGVDHDFLSAGCFSSRSPVIGQALIVCTLIVDGGSGGASVFVLKARFQESVLGFGGLQRPTQITSETPGA